MATLSDSTLTDCSYIPSFIASGTISAFEQTSAPTSWTKNTTHNNKALRLINGTISNGGSFNFTNILTNISFSGQTSNNPVGTIGIQAAAPTITLGGSTFTIGVQNALTNTPPHTHPYQINSQGNRRTGPFTVVSAVFQGLTSQNNGGSTQHPHGVNPYPTTLHAHGPGAIASQHTHPTPTSTPHSHGFSVGSINFSVNYRDVIFASKD
jgi:hypothetical protein